MRSEAKLALILDAAPLTGNPDTRGGHHMIAPTLREVLTGLSACRFVISAGAAAS